MDELLKVIFGDYTTVELLGFLWFFIIGYAAYGLVETNRRDVNGNKTPKKWSWNFWLKDNLRRYITTLLCTYILFRFYTEFIGHEFNYFEALVTGLLGDGVAAIMKKKLKIVAGNREKLMTDQNNEVT